MKEKPQIKLPLSKGEKVIQISASGKDISFYGNFHCLTNKGRVFMVYGTFNSQPDGRFKEWAWDLVI